MIVILAMTMCWVVLTTTKLAVLVGFCRLISEINSSHYLIILSDCFSFPVSVMSVGNITTFHRKLKSRLFKLAYPP